MAAAIDAGLYSVPKGLTVAITNVGNSQLVEHNGLWHSMMHHGAFSDKDKEQLIARCEQSRALLQRALMEASTVVVTFGTAWVYEMEGQVVANCHKLPASRFTRRCLTVNEIVEMWQPIVASMPDKHWIFTVSPIRHVKDGLHANQISKAILLQAVDQLGQSYFPSYEIMMDELRDYRFYAEDMVHPSAVAVEYIWQRFVDTYMNKDTQTEMRVLNQLWRDNQHRMLHPDTDEARTFLQRLAERKAQLQQRHPWIE